MNTIDQRILIPAPPDVVWAYLSDITHNPNWQADCQHVAFLTSKREGPGTRWRYSTARNREQVAEISAWYNGLGYEYTIIDGAPFRKNTGRIRLQEIPEGTVVQWTFSYEAGGLFGGGRGAGRQVETNMETSLKNLWRQITQATSGKAAHEAKSLMRDAPDVAARSQYKPRHPSLAKDEAVPAPRGYAERRPPEKPLIIEDEIGIEDLGVARFQPPVRIPEPPIAEGDTRPRPAVVEPVSTPIQASAPTADEEPDFLASLNAPATFEPDFLASMDAPSAITDLPAPIPAVKEDDTRPRPAVIEPEREIDLSEEAPPAPLVVSEFIASAEPPAPIAPEPEIAIEEAPPAPQVVVKAEAPSVPEPPADETPYAAFMPPEREIAPPAAPLPEPTVKPAPVERRISTSAELPAVRADDTGERSIWEIFGLPRPSETAEFQAVTPEAPPADPTPTPYPRVQIPSEAPRPYVGEIPSEGRVGLRLRARRKLVRVRRPL